MSIAVIILAAGNGTRMKSSLPKVLHPVAGQPLMGWAISSALELENVLSTTVVLQPGAQQVQDYVRQTFANVKIAEQNEQLGTGHAVKCGCEAIDTSAEFTLVLYGDHPFITSQTMQAMLNRLKTSENDAVTVLGFEPKDPAMYGRLILSDTGDLQAIVEYKDANESQRDVRLCNSGVMAFRTKALQTILAKLKNDNASGEYYLTDAVEIAREANLTAHVVQASEEEVMGVNSQVERAAAEAVIQRQMRENAMKNGVMMVAPETVFFSYDTKISGDITLHPNVVFGKNVVIEAGAEIKSFSHIEGAHVGANTVVGPYARLRPGADLAEGVKIGNFVEVKKAKLEQGVKINHLSYIGDAHIGAGTNVGAGVITCNYDGVNKYQTTVGAGAFIGSNSSLVAPVNVGEGAIVGAGSTVLKDVEAGALAINEMPQINHANRANELKKGA